MHTGSVVVNPRTLGPLGLVRELRRAREVGPSPETVFRLLRPFHGPELDAIYGRCMADPVARRLLEAGRSLHPALLDLPRLRDLPADTLGHAYARFMDENGIDIVSFTEASLRTMERADYANDEAWTLANRLRDIHELVHVVSGYGTDELGEMCELAFNIGEDPRPRATWLAVRANLGLFRRLGATHTEEAVREAYERGQRTRLLVGADWEALLDEPLEAVRRTLGIEAPPRHYAPFPEAGPPLPAPTPRDLLAGLLRPTPA